MRMLVRDGRLMVKAGYTGPRTVADVNLAAWDEYFREGGALNQPYWMETDRLRQIRRDFERLANLHNGPND